MYSTYDESIESYPVVVSQAWKVGNYLCHFHRGYDGRHIPPQVSFVKFVAGKCHLRQENWSKILTELWLPAALYL